MRVAAVALLILLGLAYLAKGVYTAWRGWDADYRTRAAEYASYAEGIYPNKRLKVAGRETAVIHSVYPPYAFPMMGVYFWSGSEVVDRVVVEVVSIAGLGVLGWHVRKVLAARGVEVEWWQALALPLAVSGNCSALALGQFTIISMGLLALQVMALERGRWVVAAVCWALAMIKPHLALPFAMLFPLQRQWRGLWLGGALLAVLSGWALWRTGVSPLAFFEAGPAREKLEFVATPYAAGLWVSWSGVSGRVASAGGLVVVFVMVVAAGFESVRKRLALVPAAGVSGMVAFVMFYHRQYDNLLLFPLMLAWVVQLVERPGMGGLVLSGLLALTLYLPAGMVSRSPVLLGLTLLVPVGSAVLLVMRGGIDGGMRRGERVSSR